MPRRGIAVAVIVIVACLIALALTSDLLVDWAWFSAIGHLDVFQTILGGKVVLFFAFFAGSAILLWVNGSLASKFARRWGHMHPFDFEQEVGGAQMLSELFELMRQRLPWRLLIAGVAGVLAILVAAGEVSNWDVLKARARRADGGYRVTGRKMFASMLEAADFVLVMAYPDSSTSPFAGIILLVPGEAEGRSVDPNWDVLGMRATRNDSLILEECFLPDSAAVYCSDDIRTFRHTYLNWFWGSYTPVYLGIAQAAFDEICGVVHTRQPEGYAQPLAYHPDVRRHVATMSAQLEAARLITYRSAWLSDTQGPTPETTAALYRAKYMVGER